MTQSPEYPDLRWMPPASWTNANRTSVQLIVIHTTEGSEGPSSAEDGAAYDQRRTDGTSTHFFHDSDSTVQCVRTEDIAHAARHEGNLRGIQHELCGSAYQGSVGWADSVSQGTLRQAARQCARDAKKWGIPVRKLTVAQVADGVKGFCGHVEITYAFPQDNGTHTDPGPTFPWADFLDMVQTELEVGGMAEVDLTDAAVQKIASKISADLNNTTSGIALGTVARSRAAVQDFFADAFHAAKKNPDSSLGDSVYQAASTGEQQVMRYARDIVQGTVGGPVSQADLVAAVTAAKDETLAAVANVDEEVWAKVPDPNITVAEKADLLRAVLGDDAAAVGALLAAG
jgi:N-acetyl-anhydromuramyl-L-alanine amidase AmpD